MRSLCHVRMHGRTPETSITNEAHISIARRVRTVFDSRRHVRSATFPGSIYTFAGSLFTTLLLVKKVAHDFTIAGNFVIKIGTRYSIDAAVQRVFWALSKG